MISAETVTRTWQRVGATPPHRAHRLPERMGKEQPLLMAYLLAAHDDRGFQPHEGEIVFYIGVVLWQIMRQSSRHLRQVTEAQLRRAEEANEAFLEKLSDDTVADFSSATRSRVESYPEPEVLRYLVEAIEEEPDDPDELPLSKEGRGLAFIYLKAALDAMVASLEA